MFIAVFTDGQKGFAGKCRFAGRCPSRSYRGLDSPLEGTEAQLGTLLVQTMKTLHQRLGTVVRNNRDNGLG